MATMRYFALVLPEEHGFSVVFPDFPGAGTSGDTIEEALARAEDNLAAHIEGRIAERLDIPRPRPLEAVKADPDLAEEVGGAVVVAAIAAALPDKAVRVNVTIDESLLGRIDAAAARSGETRSGFLAQSARERLARTG